MSATCAVHRARIAEIEAQICSLCTEKESVQEQLDAYKYPVLTLPNEIVSEIFIHFLPVYPVCPPLLSPTLLTRICRKWREIAIATPALWRAVPLSMMNGDNFEEQLQMLKSWIGRSAFCPLSIQMDDIFPLPRILEAIIPHRARWEYIKLLSFPSDLPTIAGPMPLLYSIDIKLYASIDSPATPFRDVPRLREATLRYFDFPPDFLPWSQLTSLTLEPTTRRECTPILAQTVNLVRCELILSSLDEDFSQLDIKLLCLESLVLVRLYPAEDPLTEYLESFIVPALLRLQIPEAFLHPNPIGTLKSFISKSGCNLEELCITGPSSLRETWYRGRFPSIPSISFNPAFTHWNYENIDDSLSSFQGSDDDDE
ncbi:hypothetical protein C8R44DRAFT_797154 [Mycena epipterygia]|nr:hypothetical protein C8R44DRAFT_797154 [Mycena epipterygia]